MITSEQNLSEKRKALYEAITQNEIEEVKKMLRDESEDFSGDAVSTPMIEAVKARRYRIMMLLFKLKVDLSRTDSKGRTALHFAAFLNYRTATLLLCIHNSPLDMKCDDGHTPLILAIARNHYDIVRILADNGATVYPPESESDSGNLPLAFASFSGFLNILQYLLKVEVADDIKREHIYCALCVACYVGRREIVEFLINYGTELSRASFLLHSPLVFAIQGNNNDIIRLLLSNGANVNERDDDGYTPIMHAVLLNNPIAVSELLSHGADTSAVAYDGQTTVATITAQLKLDEIAKLLNL